MEAMFEHQESRIKLSDECDRQSNSPQTDPIYYEDDRRKAIKRTNKLRNLLDRKPNFRDAETVSPLPVHKKQAEAKKIIDYFWKETTVLPQIEKAIDLSKYILELPENWDEEGSPSYTKETWDRATQFARKTALQYKKNQVQTIPIPEITHGPDGSIDVRWENNRRSLLLNFPADKKTPVDFFGADDENYSIQGTIKLSSQNEWLLTWLMSQS